MYRLKLAKHAWRTAATMPFALPILFSAGGCVGPCGSTPVLLLPVYAAAAPVAWTAHAIDDHSPGRSNTDFVLAGEVVDDRGQPIDCVEAESQCGLRPIASPGSPISGSSEPNELRSPPSSG